MTNDIHGEEAPENFYDRNPKPSLSDDMYDGEYIDPDEEVVERESLTKRAVKAVLRGLWNGIKSVGNKTLESENGEKFFGYAVVGVLVLLGLWFASQIPWWNATLDRIIYNHVAVTAEDQGAAGDRITGEWVGTDTHGTVWHFTLEEEGLISSITTAERTDGMLPSLDTLLPTGNPDRSSWNIKDGTIRFAEVKDGVSLKFDIEQVRPVDGEGAATALILSSGFGQELGQRKLLVERPDSLTAERPDGEPVFLDGIAGSVWSGNVGFDSGFFRFDADGSGILRVGGNERAWQVFPLTWERTDMLNGSPVERGEYVRITVPEAGKKGTIVLNGSAPAGATRISLDGNDGKGEVIEATVAAVLGAYVPVADNSIPDTVWVGTTGSETRAAVRFLADGTGELTITDFGSDSFDITWTLEQAAAGQALTVTVLDADYSGATITYSGITSPYGQDLSLAGTSPDGEPITMTLKLADMKPVEG